MLPLKLASKLRAGLRDGFQESKVYFWYPVKAKVYEGRREPFSTLDALQERIEEVWVGVVGNGATLRKAVAQFPAISATTQGHCGATRTLD